MKKLINEQFKRMQLLAGLITESQLNEAVDTKYFTMDGTKSEDLKKDFTLKSTYDPGMTMICPKDLDDKSDRADGMLGYIFSLNTLKDKELYPLKENHPDYGKMIVMSQSTKEDLSNLIKKLGGIQIDVRAKKQEPTSESTDIVKSVNEALRKYRRMLNENPVRMSMQEFMPKIDEITKKMNIHLMPQVLGYNDFVSKMNSIKGDFSKAGVTGDKTVVIAATGVNGQADSLCCFSLSDDPTNSKASFKLIDNFYEVVKKEFPATTFKQFNSTPYDVTGEFAKLHGEKVVVGMAVITNFVKPAAAAPTAESTNIVKSVNEALRKYRKNN